MAQAPLVIPQSIQPTLLPQVTPTITTALPKAIVPVEVKSPTPIMADDYKGREKWGKRPDGSDKGLGFLGLLPHKGNQVSSEISIGINVNGKEMEVPSLVPTLTPAEVNHMLSGGKPTPEIIRKASEHAQMRLKEGKPVFATDQESPSFKQREK